MERHEIGAGYPVFSFTPHHSPLERGAAKKLIYENPLTEAKGLRDMKYRDLSIFSQLPFANGDFA